MFTYLFGDLKVDYQLELLLIINNFSANHTNSISDNSMCQIIRQKV